MHTFIHEALTASTVRAEPISINLSKEEVLELYKELRVATSTSPIHYSVLSNLKQQLSITLHKLGEL